MGAAMSQVFPVTSLGGALGLDFGIQAVAGAAAILCQTEKWYDATGSATWLALALGSLK